MPRVGPQFDAVIVRTRVTPSVARRCERFFAALLGTPRPSEGAAIYLVRR